jgi:uncharacterized membrane protein
MPSAQTFFTKQEQDLLLNAIAEAERFTSGEIRLHIQNWCLGNPLKEAKKIFARLKMHQTDQRNGVLIFIAVRSRKLAIFGDEGIHQKLGAEFWDKLVKQLIEQFRANHKADGLAECIKECGRQLGAYFPLQDGDKNELSNDISF